MEIGACGGMAVVFRTALSLCSLVEGLVRLYFTLDTDDIRIVAHERSDLRYTTSMY